jgi:hypothetical protein
LVKCSSSAQYQMQTALKENLRGRLPFSTVRKISRPRGIH